MQIASQFAKQTFDGIDIKKEFLIYWIIDFSIDVNGLRITKDVFSRRVTIIFYILNVFKGYKW